MINKILKDFRNAIHKNLKVEPQNKKSSCFVICENEEKSAIKQIHFIFKNQDDVLILKQDRTRELKQNYTIENLFEIQSFTNYFTKKLNLKIIFNNRWENYEKLNLFFIFVYYNK